jgi:hypothetical protein
MQPLHKLLYKDCANARGKGLLLQSHNAGVARICIIFLGLLSRRVSTPGVTKDRAGDLACAGPGSPALVAMRKYPHALYNSNTNR